jgi:hypothetical protein
MAYKNQYYGLTSPPLEIRRQDHLYNLVKGCILAAKQRNFSLVFFTDDDKICASVWAIKFITSSELMASVENEKLTDLFIIPVCCL